MHRNPRIGINLHYDDLYSSAVASTRLLVENRLIKATSDLETVVHDELKATIAEHKAVVIASDFGLQRRLASRLGRLGGGGLEVSAANLGVDYMGGRQMRTASRMSHLRRRFRKNTSRGARILRISRGCTKTATDVFRQGLVPSIGYGSQIWGMPPDLLAKLRASYASFVMGHGQCKNHSKVLLLRGDPTCIIATAPLATLVDLIWASLTGIPGLPSLPQLCSWWQAISQVPKRWDQIRGPIGATKRMMQHLGWTIKDERPIIFRSRDGTELNIFEMGPQLVKAQIYRDWHDMLAETLASKHGLPDGERIDFEHAKKHLSNNSHLSDREKATAANFLVWGLLGCAEANQSRL